VIVRVYFWVAGGLRWADSSARAGVACSREKRCCRRPGIRVMRPPLAGAAQEATGNKFAKSFSVNWGHVVRVAVSVSRVPLYLKERWPDGAGSLLGDKARTPWALRVRMQARGDRRGNFYDDNTGRHEAY
jgi:hypothetical protein